eukprot:PhM_4_TR18442/c0_g1_i1/m.72896
MPACSGLPLVPSAPPPPSPYVRRRNNNNNGGRRQKKQQQRKVEDVDWGLNLGRGQKEWVAGGSSSTMANKRTTSRSGSSTSDPNITTLISTNNATFVPRVRQRVVQQQQKQLYHSLTLAEVQSIMERANYDDSMCMARQRRIARHARETQPVIDVPSMVTNPARFLTLYHVEADDLKGLTPREVAAASEAAHRAVLSRPGAVHPPTKQPVPGPGAYDPKPVHRPNTAPRFHHDYKRWRTRGCLDPARVGGGADIPGPGAYNPQAAASSSSSCVHVSRVFLSESTRPTEEASAAARRRRMEEGGPGPGAYEHTHNTAVGNHVKGVSLRSRHTVEEQRALREASMIPGPGAYNHTEIEDDADRARRQRQHHGAGTRAAMLLSRLKDITIPKTSRDVNCKCKSN